MNSIFSRPNYRHRLTEQTIKEIKTNLAKKKIMTPKEKDEQPLPQGAVSGSFLSDLNFIIDNMGYDLVKDKVSKEAQTEYLKRLKMMRDELRQDFR